MAYYNWETIVSNYSDNELKRIYNEKYKEPEEKVLAVVDELIKRGLLSADKNVFVIPEDEDFVRPVERVAGRTKPNTPRARLTMLAIAVMLILYVVSLYSSALQYDLLNDLENGISISQQELEANDNRAILIDRIVLISYILTSIVFLTWFTRAYDNLAIRVNKTKYADSWSLFAWFVPIISWFRPFSIMSELNTKSDVIIKERGIALSNDRKTLIGFWWGLFLISTYLSRVFVKMTNKLESVDDYVMATVGDMVISVFGIILAIITILMIKGFANKEELLFASEKK